MRRALRPARLLGAIGGLVATIACGRPGWPASPEPVSPGLEGYRLDIETPVDPGLQAALEAADRRIAGELGIPDASRACGILDLTDLRLAAVRPDALFYGASVPKIGILLGWFATRPDPAERLDPAVERELQLMIRRSSNELAAKYSQLVGLDAIQRVLQSPEHRLYDPARGGGIWCGKHYGIDEPRLGDPVGNYSHAVTVRQCLRYYLLLEQGRLVSPAASRAMRGIFEGPSIEAHDDGFVAGLRGRDVTLVRKNGLWEDWHLDTARVRHGGRAYLLAAVARHAAGEEYLRRVAAAVDETLCGPSVPKPFIHALVLHEDAATFARGSARNGSVAESPPGVLLRLGGRPAGEVDHEDVVSAYESPIVVASHPFNEVLPSWNVDVPPGVRWTFELRVGRGFDGSWSPWLQVDDSGSRAGDAKPGATFEEGRIDVDWFRSERRFDRAGYRIRVVSAETGAGAEGPTLRIRRVGLCLSDTTGLPHSVRPPRTDAAAPPAAAWERALPVPLRSQRAEERAVAGRICSPTSLAMVLAYRGVDRPTMEVAARAFDPAHDIYGNWPRNVQAAWTWGVPGHIARYAGWEEVEREISGARPLIISIRASAGELRGAPYPTTDGHLLVLVGFTADGGVVVNDPASPDLAAVRRVYRRADVEAVWLRKGGTAYVLGAPER